MLGVEDVKKSESLSASGPLWDLTQDFLAEEEALRQVSDKGRQRQERLGRLLVRDRIRLLLDQNSSFFELGLWAAHDMYKEWGKITAAGLVTGIGTIEGRQCMIVANDATVKAGAMFPQSIKKFLRAQRIAFESKLPLVYLVDSAGVFLPLQDEIFPDEDDFGRIFRNNSVISAAGIPQIAAVMGNCIAGGGYLPVLCDKLLMTEGSGLYLAGPALVKAAIGQVVDTEELGGAKMHSEISGTVDFCEKDDESCLKKIRSLVSMLPSDETFQFTKAADLPSSEAFPVTEKDVSEVYQYVGVDGRKPYDVRDLLSAVIDQGSFTEYKADFGKTIVTGFARIGGYPVGIVANQKVHSQSPRFGVEIGGVIYADSADKAARFVMDCNQSKVPILFLQDVTGFMVGKEAEQTGIIKSGAKLVNAISNSTVPKITLIIGNSFGAGHYAMCGKAYDPNFILAWPNAKYAVMGADQAADTLLAVKKKAAQASGQQLSDEDVEEMRQDILKRYKNSVDIRYGASRGWVDAIIAPDETRHTMIRLLSLVDRGFSGERSFHTGVFQT